MVKGDCLNCGSEFESVQPRAIYCSENCQKRARVKRKKQRDPEFRKRFNKKTAPKKKAKHNRNRRVILDYKLSHPCPCGESHPACLVFHHRDPKTKKFAIAHAYRAGISLESLFVEMEKCDILCSNCHLKLHYEQPVPQDIRIKPDVAGL